MNCGRVESKLLQKKDLRGICDRDLASMELISSIFTSTSNRSLGKS